MASRKPVYLDFANGQIIEMAAGDTIDTSVATNVGGGGGAFTDLSDVPASYTGQATKVVRVNAGETALEFATVAGTGDVVGPASSVTNRVALFDGTTGKLLKDSGKLTTDFANSTHTHAATDIGAGTVDNTEFGYLNGVTSAIQTQLDGKAASSHTHTATAIGAGTVDDTEFGYLNGVTSSIQTQIDGKQASLGYTPENVANKATTYDTVNDTLYPTTAATEARYVPLSSGVQNLAVNMVSNADQTIATNYGMSVPDRYEVGGGFNLTISENAILMIL